MGRRNHEKGEEKGSRHGNKPQWELYMGAWSEWLHPSGAEGLCWTTGTEPGILNTYETNPSPPHPKQNPPRKIEDTHLQRLTRTSKGFLWN